MWLGWWLGGPLYWHIRFLVVIIKGQGAVLHVNLGQFMVANGKFDRWLCVSGCSGRVVTWGDESGQPQNG